MGKRAESKEKRLERIDESLIIVLVMLAIIYSLYTLIKHLPLTALLIPISAFAIAYLHYRAMIRHTKIARR